MLTRLVFKFIVIIFCLTTSPLSSHDLSAISSEDEVILEQFFRTLLSDTTIGYSLFGNKPVSFESLSSPEGITSEDYRTSSLLLDLFCQQSALSISPLSNCMAFCAMRQMQTMIRALIDQYASHYIR